METVAINYSSARVRRTTFQGRQYLVAPMSLIVPGVLNGSKGPLYYPPDEVAKDPTIWNNVPIVVHHPTQGGSAVSARDPEVLENQGVGFVSRAKYTGRKLVAEGWFDVDSLKRIDPKILDNLEAGRPVELSTGLYTDNQPAENGASHNGRTYSYIARNYKADHLAVFSDATGACSLKDGCGVLVNKVSSVLGSNIYCKTGRGGGIDPSCPASSKSGVDPAALERIKSSLISSMKLKSTTIGIPGAAHSVTTHVVSVAGVDIGRITQKVEALHITQGGGSRSTFTLRSMKDKPIGGSYSSLSDAKDGLASYKARKSLEKQNASKNKPTDNVWSAKARAAAIAARKRGARTKRVPSRTQSAKDRRQPDRTLAPTPRGSSKKLRDKQQKSGTYSLAKPSAGLKSRHDASTAKRAPTAKAKSKSVATPKSSGKPTAKSFDKSGYAKKPQTIRERIREKIAGAKSKVRERVAGAKAKAKSKVKGVIGQALSRVEGKIAGLRKRVTGNADLRRSVSVY